MNQVQDPMTGVKYKEDQGRHARMAAFWTLTLLVLFGCHFLFEQLVQFDAMQEPVGGVRIPVVGVDLSPAFLVAAMLFGTGAYFVHRWQAKPKVADLLIDTEDELKKVTWPTLEEVVNSSIVVVMFVVFIGAYLALADYLLNRVIQTLLRGGGA